MMRSNEINSCPTVQFEHPILEDLSVEFPSFQLFYGWDKKTLLNTANSLVVMNHLIGGTKKDYEDLIRSQKEGILDFSTYCRLVNFFYRVKVKPNFKKMLRTFIYLDGICRTEGSKKLVYILPIDRRGNQSRDLRALAIINYELLDETKHLRIEETDVLRQSFFYRMAITGQAPEYVKKYDDEIMRIVQAATICDIAGLASDAESIGSSKTLNESMANQLINYIDNRYDQAIAKEFCSLTLD